MDPRLWKNPATLDPSRFLVADEKEAKKFRADMLHSTPFGGAHSVCKGRYFAEREVLTFVADFITVWDLEPVGKEWVKQGKFIMGPGQLMQRVVFESRCLEGFEVYAGAKSGK